VSPTVGDKLTLTIRDLAFGGEGVARDENFVVFVPFVASGEVVEAEITEVKKRFARARLLRVISPSSERVQPRCRYFGQCGGCQYQHLDYSAQLQLKHGQVCELFHRLGGFDPKLVAPVIPCSAPYGYRNRIMVRSQWDKFKQGLNIGFIRADNRLVVDIEDCQIAEPALNEQITQVRAHPPPKGGIKVVLRVVPEGWDVPKDSFFQNNSFLAPKLVEVARECLRHAGTRYLLDLFCGVGFFGLELAGQVESYVGVELDGLAIQAARRNAAARGQMNGEFLAGTTEDWLPKLIGRFPPQATTVMLDPPRKGCRPEVLHMLREVRPKQIVYVSCDPATMARDLKALCAGGVFQLVQVVPVDMFPQTAHIESIADLRCGNEEKDVPAPAGPQAKPGLPIPPALIQH
jgi:tRNA/tmRNA/rRNA uracil-C5-methylase (TrmA/RlmC/RlmD family)